MRYIKKISIFAMLLFLSMASLNAQITATIKHKNANQKGEISLSINSGTAPYSITWRKTGAPSFSATNTTTISNLDPGEYCVIIEDAKCCSADQCFTIKDECDDNLVKIGYKKNQFDCGNGKVPGAADGKIELDVPNPNDYTYCWKQFQNDPVCAFSTQNIDNIGVGTYYVTVTNKNNGCKVMLQTEICCCYYDDEGSDSPPPSTICKLKNTNAGYLNVTPTPTPPTGTGSNNGSISLAITGGGSAGYTIRWTGPNGFKSNEASIGNLAPGIYCYIVTDGCTEKKDCIEMYVCGDNPINISGKLTRPCDAVKHLYPKAAGSISITVTGGKPPYKYLWNNGKTGTSLSNLSSGTYSVIVTDKSGCTSQAVFNLANMDVTKEIVTCAIEEYCGPKEHNRFLISTKYDPVWFVDNWDCTLLNGYCPLNGDYMDTKINPNPQFVSTRIDNNCTIWGKCSSGLEKRIGQLTFKSDIFGYFDNRCKCYKCMQVDYCQDFWGVTYKVIREIKFSSTYSNPYMANGSCFVDVFCKGTLIDIINVDSKYCGISKIATQSNMTVGDYLSYASQNIQEFKGDRKFYLPKYITLNTLVSDFEQQTTSEDYEIHEVNLDDYTPKECSQTTCSSQGITNGDSGRISPISGKNGVKTFMNDGVSIYPNPAENVVNINIPHHVFPNSIIEIVNTLGQKVYTKACGDESNINVDISKFVSGAYRIIVKDCNNQQIFNDTLIKQ